MSDLGVVLSGGDFTWQVDVTIADGMAGESITEVWFDLMGANGSSVLSKTLTANPTEVLISDDTLSVKLTDTETAPFAGKYFTDVKVKRSDGLFGYIPSDTICFNDESTHKSQT